LSSKQSNSVSPQQKIVTMVVSKVRKVALQHVAIKLREHEAAAAVGESTIPPLLGKNEMQLFSYYKPGLSAGAYEIFAEQNIAATNSAGTQTFRVYNRLNDTDHAELQPQRFEVMGPQFSLDPTLINSYYPPNGHQDDARILPHIVLNDPHFPWEREPGVYVRALQDQDPAKGTPADPAYRSMVPWIAIIVFDPDELKLTDGEGKALNIPGFDVTKQRPNGTFPMTVSNYIGRPATDRMNYEAGFFEKQEPPLPPKFNAAEFAEIQNSREGMNAIFPTKQLFKNLFQNLEHDQPRTRADDKAHVLNWDNFKTTDDKGKPVRPPDVGNIPAFRYLAHVRNINTSGCPGAGIDELGFFSVVMSCRTGRFDQDKPVTQVAHLVSIEHVDSTYGTVVHQIQADSKAADERIGMVSLFSWVYTVGRFPRR
jgi:hypothetical protein